MRGLVGGLQNRLGSFDSNIALLLRISTQVVKEDSLQNYYVVGSNPAWCAKIWICEADGMCYGLNE